MVSADVTIRWLPRESPLPAAAVAAWGDAAGRLLRRVLRFDDDHLAQLLGAASDEGVVLRGASDGADPAMLPWVDGVRYLGVDPAAPGLLLPTLLRPNVPVPLLSRALQRKAVPPLAILVSSAAALPRVGVVVVSLARALPLDRSTIEAWLSTSAQRGRPEEGLSE